MPPGFVEWLPPGLSLEILEHKNLIRISQLLLHLCEGIFVLVPQSQVAEPFVWTKSEVHQRRVKGRRLSDL